MVYLGDNLLAKQQSEVWISIISDYSRRLLTIQDDWLHALAGIAQEKSANIWEDQYFAGMRKKCLLDLLGWCHTPPVRKPKVEVLIVVPTWPWVSLYIQFKHVVHRDAEILGCRTTTLRLQAPYNQVKYGELHTRGRLFSAYAVDSSTKRR